MLSIILAKFQSLLPSVDEFVVTRAMQLTSIHDPYWGASQKALRLPVLTNSLPLTSIVYQDIYTSSASLVCSITRPFTLTFLNGSSLPVHIKSLPLTSLLPWLPASAVPMIPIAVRGRSVVGLVTWCCVVPPVFMMAVANSHRQDTYLLNDEPNVDISNNHDSEVLFRASSFSQAAF